MCIRDSNHTIQLSNQRLGSGTITSAPGTTIGEARVYSFGLTDAAYTGDASTWDLFLFDVQTYTQISVNLALSNAELPATSYVEGISSGAFGYAVSAGGGGTDHMLVQTSGTFIRGEALRINGSTILPRSVTAVKVFGTQDIKSVYQNTGGSGGILATTTVDFAADTVLSRVIPKGFTVADQLVINASGIASCAGRNFSGIKSDTIIRYQRPNFGEIFNRVKKADEGILELAAVENVTGVCTATSLNIGTGATITSAGAGFYAGIVTASNFVKRDGSSMSPLVISRSDNTVFVQGSNGQSLGSDGGGNNDNTFFGNNAGYNATGSSSYNTYIGFRAAQGTATGSYNTFLGFYAGIDVNNASNNTYVCLLYTSPSPRDS